MDDWPRLHSTHENEWSAARAVEYQRDSPHYWYRRFNDETGLWEVFFDWRRTDAQADRH